jgi:hypothetical protein
MSCYYHSNLIILFGSDLGVLGHLWCSEPYHCTLDECIMNMVRNTSCVCEMES